LIEMDSEDRGLAGIEWLPFRLTMCGIEELAGHGAANVTHVLSILDPGWPEPEALGRFDVHNRLKLRFHDVIDPRPDCVPPQAWDIELLLAFGRELAASEDSHLLVHCHAGVSRSTAAAALILAQSDPDRAPADLLQAIAQLRPRAWPNLRILELGDAALGRSGEIAAAAATLYHSALEREPWLAEAMIEGGRAREIAAAERFGIVAAAVSAAGANVPLTADNRRG
jgi:predicted protein tyrosine phosphatase